MDGVYIKVKGLPKAIPFIYGIDFETHDIPASILALAENEAAFRRLFFMLRDVGYPLRLVVTDEIPALKGQLTRVFPGIEVQLCHVHVMRNVRTMLHLSVRDTTHLSFFRALQKLMALPGEEARQRYLGELRAYARVGLYGDVLQTIMDRWEGLFRFESIRKQGLRCPATNNLIEAYNSHFKSRVRSIKGFESLSSASRWLNGWVLKRRFTPFRECGKPFEHLNGYSSFEKSRNPDLPWPKIFGISPPENQPENER